MVGYLPENCPFCGAAKEKFITSEDCSARYKVIEIPVTSKVSRLNSTPRLGLEHAAYRINTGNRIYWIDCPSCFDRSLIAMNAILFTHFHFLGASNQYREHFSSSVQIHHDDSRFRLCRGFTFDRTFDTDFMESGIEAHHIDGHTPGFTCFFFENIFFVCERTGSRSLKGCWKDRDNHIISVCYFPITHSVNRTQFTGTQSSSQLQHGENLSPDSITE
jgi:hydroxyacylglutathione hydrolase